MRLVGENALLGGPAAFALLAPDLLPPRLRSRPARVPCGLNLVEEQHAVTYPIDTLVPAVLALDEGSRGAMNQLNARGDLVHVLTAMTAGPHEGLLQIRFQHAQPSHAFRKRIFPWRR